MNTHFGSICVIGLGYIGLPTAAVFADHGLNVVGVDINQDIVASINQGQAHFGEPNLEALLQRVVKQDYLKAYTSPQPADVFIITVPTPCLAAVHQDSLPQPDLGYIKQAAIDIAPQLQKGNLVILESTSPVGTTHQLSEHLSQLRPDLSFPHSAGEFADIHIAHCPERVLPGRILHEVVNNPRIIGGITRQCAQKAFSLYRIIVTGDCHLTDAKTAEMAKLTENAFRDVNIAFANELSMICDHWNVDVWELIRLANLHPRVNILKPGPGVGGHCIAVDPWFLASGAPEKAPLIIQSRRINLHKTNYVTEQILSVSQKFRQPKIACLGLSYKADVDDLRESPAMEIVGNLAKHITSPLMVVEPHIHTLPDTIAMHDHIHLSDFDRAIESADIIALLVDHRAFSHVKRNLLWDKLIIDTRGMW